MAIGRISGPLLKDNLLRNGVDLAFETDLLYLDVTNRRIGVKTTSPQYALDINGVARVTDLEITNNIFQIGNLTIDGDNNSIETTAQEFAIATADNTIVGNRVLVGDLEINNNFIENTNSAKTGYIGGLNLPIIFSWPIAGLFCGVIAFLIGKIALGLRSDYLAIATLGISEIIIYIIKNEEWLARGVKNVNGLPRPVPYEIDLQKNEFIQTLSNTLNLSVIELSSLIVKGLYSILFILVLLIIFFLLQKAIKSPWGRMMRAVRDNETSAEAMGINVKKRHLQVFIIGSAIIGISGAMLTTLDGQFTPSSYQPLRYTFLIWIMVIIGGSGNNHGAIIGGFAIWFFWIQAEPIGIFLIELITIFLSDQNEIKLYLLNHAAYMRLLLMGLVLILALRFFPKGIIEEEKRL